MSISIWHYVFVSLVNIVWAVLYWRERRKVIRLKERLNKLYGRYGHDGDL